MKYTLLLIAAFVCLIGCGRGEHSQMDTHSDLKDIKTTTQPKDAEGAIRMPGGIGVTAGQTGTGTTSG